jgi:rare lipoprotein A
MILLFTAGCSARYPVVDPGPYAGFVQTGDATWYGKPYHGRTTASGEKYNMRKQTAAHHILPFGVRVRVTNLRTGEHVVVRINDRVPAGTKCAIDLSRAAFKEIAPLDAGRVPVRIDVLD